MPANACSFNEIESTHEKQSCTGAFKRKYVKKKWISLSFREGQLWILIKSCHLSVVDGMCYTEVWLDGLCPLFQWFLPQYFLLMEFYKELKARLLLS